MQFTKKPVFFMLVLVVLFMGTIFCLKNTDTTNYFLLSEDSHLEKFIVTDKNSLDIELTTNKESYIVGEEIILHVILKNPNDYQIEVKNDDELDEGVSVFFYSEYFKDYKGILINVPDIIVPPNSMEIWFNTSFTAGAFGFYKIQFCKQECTVQVYGMSLNRLSA